MRLTVIGCSPAWPNAGGAQSGYLLESAGPGRLLLDCGPGVLARLRSGGGWPAVDTIALSHFHHDHWGDLVSWVWGSLHGPGAGAPGPELLTPPGGRERLRSLGDALGGAPDLFERVFRIREYADGEEVETAGLVLRPMSLPHYGVDAYGFRVSDGTVAVAYSGDSAPTDRLVDLARDTDLFLCEATLAQPEHGPRGHLTLDEARSLFERSGSARLLVTHRPAELAVPPECERAADGLELELEPAE